VSTASRLRTWFSIDPQPASISPTINISIVFICTFPVDHGQIVCCPAIKNDSSAILGSGKRFVLRADEKLTAFLELESAIRAERPEDCGGHEIKLDTLLWIK
jgi:hypothetical protein